jgi:hypothetical protein
VRPRSIPPWSNLAPVRQGSRSDRRPARRGAPGEGMGRGGPGAGRGGAGRGANLSDETKAQCNFWPPAPGPYKPLAPEATRSLGFGAPACPRPAAPGPGHHWHGASLNAAAPTRSRACRCRPGLIVTISDLGSLRPGRRGGTGTGSRPVERNSPDSRTGTGTASGIQVQLEVASVAPASGGAGVFTGLVTVAA